MHRIQRLDAAFDALCEQRDHVAIQVSLAWDVEPTDLVRLSTLQSQLRALDRQTLSHKPAQARDAIAVTNRAYL